MVRSFMLLLPALFAVMSAAIADATPHAVSFPADDGGIVFADVYGSGDHAVLLAHGGRFEKESWRAQAAWLQDAGYRVLAINFRGRGESGGGADADGYYRDVLAGVRYLRESGATVVDIVGASFGGGAAAEASIVAARGDINRLILLAASSIEAPERMQGCKLFITTAEDFRGEGILRLPEIRDQFERTPPPKSLVILSGDAHAQYIFETDQADRLKDEILGFLSSPCP